MKVKKCNSVLLGWYNLETNRSKHCSVYQKVDISRGHILLVIINTFPFNIYATKTVQELLIVL